LIIKGSKCFLLNPSRELYISALGAERVLMDQVDVEEITKVIPLLPNLVKIPALSRLVSLQRGLMSVVNAHEKLRAIEIDERAMDTALEWQVPFERVYLTRHMFLHPGMLEHTSRIGPRICEALARGAKILSLHIYPGAQLFVPPLRFPAPKKIHLRAMTDESWTSHGLHALLDSCFQLFRGSPEELGIHECFETIILALKPQVPLFARLSNILDSVCADSRFYPVRMRLKRADCPDESKGWRAWISEAVLTVMIVELPIDTLGGEQSEAMSHVCSCRRLLHSWLGLVATEAKDLENLSILGSLATKDATLGAIEAFFGLTPDAWVSQRTYRSLNDTL
jgi:hypothetical protein